jgi:hypothetical protein
MFYYNKKYMKNFGKKKYMKYFVDYILLIKFY